MMMCDLCGKPNNILSCNSCDKKVCQDCIVEFTANYKFINRNCYNCKNIYRVNDMYNAFGNKFMNDTYTNLIIKNKIENFEKSIDILKDFDAIYESFQSLQTFLNKIDDKISLINATNKNRDKQSIHKKIDKLKSSRQSVLKKIEVQREKSANIVLSFGEKDIFVQFLKCYENNDVHFQIIKTYISTNRKQLFAKSQRLSDNIFNNVEVELVSINNAFHKINRFVSSIGEFRRVKEILRKNIDTSLITSFINYKIKSIISEKEFHIIAHKSFIDSLKIDSVLDNTRISWGKIHTIQEKCCAILMNNHENLDVELRDWSLNLGKINKLLTEFNCENIQKEDTITKNKMKKRFAMSDEDIIEYWTFEKIFYSDGSTINVFN